jgi:hypothetical protein
MSAMAWSRVRFEKPDSSSRLDCRILEDEVMLIAQVVRRRMGSAHRK